MPECKGPFTRDGVGAVHGDGNGAVKMGCMVTYETIYTSMAPAPMPSTAPIVNGFGTHSPTAP